MPRPRSRRRIRFRPRARFFKPQGIPLRVLEIVQLTDEESEALRLKHLKKLDQKECAKEMKTSPSTFQRILSSAHAKISEAMVQGKAVRIVN